MATNLVSFPPVEETEPAPSLYTKLSSVASNMLQFVRKEEPAPQKLDYAESVRSNSDSIVLTNGLGLTRPNSVVSVSGKLQAPPFQSQLQQQLQQQLQSSKSPLTPHVSTSSQSSKTNIKAITKTKTKDIANDSSHLHRPPLLTMATQSSAVVALSTEQAVPELPSVISPISSLNESPVKFDPDNGIRDVQFGRDVNFRSQKSRLDSESVMSVSSSASKAYLAFQLSRTKDKPTPKPLSKDFWMKDESAISCYGCNRVFTTLRRKHHCRVCGQIFCSACTTLVDGSKCEAPQRSVRCCRACEAAIQTPSSSEDEMDTSMMTQVHFDDTNPNLSFHATGGYDSSDDSTDIDTGNEEGYSMRLSPHTDELHVARSFLVTPRSYRKRNNSMSSFKHEDHQHTFRPRSSSFNLLSTNNLNLNLNLNMNSPNVHNDAFPHSTARFPDSASVELNKASLVYLSLFLDQLLRDSELDPVTWNAIISVPLHQVAAGLHLELNDRISPREWVKIKRIPGGVPEDIECVNGTVLTHTLARSTMPQTLERPQILLISFPIAYTRNGKYTSLEPVIAQQKEFLKKLVARITALKPDLLLSTSYICGEAIEMLENSGVAVAQNVRESALFRIGNITGGDILFSTDKLQSYPKLGSCKSFQVRSYQDNNVVKTFFFFFVNPDDPGRCALIRGDPYISGVIKVVMEVMTEICYSLKAETALMRDQFVQLPSHIEPPSLILSSSPFVNYGTPFLQLEAQRLEDRVVQIDIKLDSTTDEIGRYLLQNELEYVRSKWIAAAEQWEKYEAMNPYIFNPSSHQNLLVLYSLMCQETQTPCIGPEPQLIEFYLNTDETLGMFVEKCILQAEEMCPEGCSHGMSSHYRSFVNGDRSVTVHVSKFPCRVPGLQDSILMWSYCTKCQQQMPVVPMSSTTWKYSMGKYLELSFYGECLKMRASPCTHDIYRDHIRYFGWQDYALSIEYSSVDINEVSLPPKHLLWDAKQEILQKEKYYMELKLKFELFWSSVNDTLKNLSLGEDEDEDTRISFTKRIAELIERNDDNKQLLLSKLDTVNAESKPFDYLSLNKVLEVYQLTYDQLQNEFLDLDNVFFHSERDLRQVAAQHIRGLLREDKDRKLDSRLNPSIQSLEVKNPNSSTSDNDSDISQHLEQLSRELEKKIEKERLAFLDRRKMTMSHPVAEVFEDVSEPIEDHVKRGDIDDKKEQKSLLQSLTNFWAEGTTSRWSGIRNVLEGQHFFINTPVVIREDELSSVIAFCLSLPDYKTRVQTYYAKKDDDDYLEQTMLRETGTHMRYQFDRNNTKISCKIFFCEQFDALRQKCMNTDKFIQSLSRCGIWNSAGGKSGSAFMKTADDRFIIKELSHIEFAAFAAFAPSYFEYLAQALFHDLPTVLAKLFGVYQVTIRKLNTTGTKIKMYVVVMENLFYGDRSTKFFDLKGSMRNRKVTETGKAKEVLLDENMVEYIYEKPLFVREHSKRTLRASLYNDTLFLTKMNIMDYSLVIGLDMDRKTIVAGVIDYIRTYTWDKKVESWVKARTTSAAIKEPTVISPKQYKNRFRESMERYFIMVPDCWSQPAL